MKPARSARPRLLFVCARNRWRSPTAERIYRSDPRIDVRSAGLSPQSRHQLSAADLAWASLLLVMEHRHKSRIQTLFPEVDPLPRIAVLDIPDDYEFMDPDLVELITERVESLLASLLDQSC